MSDPYLGQLLLVGFNYAPFQWAFAQGQTLQISTNAALFSLYGVQFGGNGTTNFMLPNLQGILSTSQGQGPGLSPYIVGQNGGSATVTLIDQQNPSHNHTAVANVGRGVNLETSPVAHSMAESPAALNVYGASTAPLNSQLNNGALFPEGGGQPHNNVMPYLSLNWIVALQGIFPPRG